METTNTTAAATKTNRPKMMDIIRARQELRGRNWEPTSEPWRLSVTVTSEWSGHISHCATFATKEEALEALTATMPRSAYHADVCLAINPENWIDRGRWQKIAHRRPGKLTKLTSK